LIVGEWGVSTEGPVIQLGKDTRRLSPSRRLRGIDRQDLVDLTREEPSN